MLRNEMVSHNHGYYNMAAHRHIRITHKCKQLTGKSDCENILDFSEKEDVAMRQRIYCKTEVHRNI